MPSRRKSLENPVELWHDGTRVTAERGEPLAHALVAADRLPLARSPKLHRPRGPYCLRGGCDGCLARVNGVPNVMTCLQPAEGGERVETQNVLGTRGIDALRAADFLFPRGIDHHRLLAGIRGVSSVVQSFARRVAGLGRLPDETLPATRARREEIDVLVIGGGAAGLAALAEVAEGAVLVDDGPALGGRTSAIAPSRAAELERGAVARGGRALARTTAVALFREPERSDGRLHALALDARSATLFVPRAVIVASGRHEPVAAFGENDLPGVYSVHAALLLWRGGISLGKRIALVGGGPSADAFLRAVEGEIETLRASAVDVVRAVGRSKVSAIEIGGESGERREKVDAIVIGGQGSPSLELAVQAGATVEFDALGGYRSSSDADGLAAPGLYLAGSVRGAEDSAADGARVGAVVRAALGL